MTRVILLALAVLTGSAMPAAAEFTSAEAASMKRLFVASAQYLRDGVNAELVPALTEQTNAATRPKIAAVLRLIIRAQRDTGRAIADLTGGSYGPDDPRGRGFFVGRAMQQLSATQATLVQAQAAINSAIGSGVNSYYMSRLRDNRIGGALANLRAFDKRLAYADPYPPGRSPAGRILVIGPHGEYDQVQRRLASAVEFTLLAFDAITNAYDADTLLRSYWHVSQQVKFASLIYGQNVQGMATVAGIPLSAAETKTSPFFRVLGRIETLTHGGGGPCQPDNCHGTPYSYNNLMQRLVSAMPDWAGRPTFAARQRDAIHRVTEAWDATDTAVWFILAFPACDHQHAPAGCGGR